MWTYVACDSKSSPPGALVLFGAPEMEIIWYGHVVGTLEDTQVETTGLRAGDHLFHKISGRWTSRGTTASTAFVNELRKHDGCIVVSVGGQRCRLSLDLNFSDQGFLVFESEWKGLS